MKSMKILHVTAPGCHHSNQGDAVASLACWTCIFLL